MAFWHRKKQELTLEQQVLGILLDRPRDLAGISIELLEFDLEFDEAELKRVLTSLVESELIEVHFDPRQPQDHSLNFVLWGPADGLRKKTREQRKAHALAVLAAASA